MRLSFCGGVGLGVGLLAWACGGVKAGAPHPKAAPTSEARLPCSRLHAHAIGEGLGASLAGGPIALARQGENTIAYVADEDTSSLYTVDAGSLTELARTPLEGKPSQVLVHPDGRVFVAIRDRAEISVLEPAAEEEEPLDALCSIPTPTEPVALAWTPGARDLVVSSGWSRTLSMYDAKRFARAFEVKLPRDPRAVVVSDDGTKAYVAHATGGQLSVVHWGSGTARASSVWLGTQGNLDVRNNGTQTEIKLRSQRFGSQGYALAKMPDTTGRILAPQVLVDRGDVERPTSSGYSDSRLPQVANIAVLDEDVGAVLHSSLDDSLDPAVNLNWGEQQVNECLLPRVAALGPKGQNLFVGCLGIDQIIEYDALSADPRRAETRRWAVPAGPTGLAVAPDGRKLLVWSQFERTLSVIDRTRVAGVVGEPTAELLTLVLSRPAGAPIRGDIALGRKLFHDVGNRAISSDGRSCASCHIEGRDDGLTWATPDGPRQTPVLMGRLTGTAPFGWTGSAEKLSDHMKKTFTRLGGEGLEKEELGALLAYVASLEPPLEAALPPTETLERGRALFSSAETGCATCHQGRRLTDGSLHEVGSAATGDRTGAFDTPSLLLVGASAPYFHDGRFAKLEDMLEATSGKMGHTSQMSPADKAALVAYLKTL